MRSLRLPFSAAALALAVSVAVLPAHAAVFAQFSPNTGDADFKWVRSSSPDTGGDLFSITSASATSSQGVATTFSFLDPALSALAFLPSTFKLTANAPSGNPATDNGGGLFTQLGINGNFSFTYAGVTQIVGGHLLVHNITNLLSGVFTNAWMQGAGASGSANLAATSGNLSMNSDLETFANLQPNSEEFAYNLLAVSPNFGATPGSALDSFKANGGGNFSFQGVPEPASWALMIAGFGAMGGMLRARRRLAAA